MRSAEDELEAVIWAAMRACRMTTPVPLEFIALMKSAAQTYSAGDSDELTAMRREVLNEAQRYERKPRPVVAGADAAIRPELDPSGSAELAARLKASVESNVIHRPPDSLAG